MSFSALYQRVPSLEEGTREALHPYMTGILRNEGCVPIQVGGFEDHVHVLFGLSRTLAIAKLVETLKTGSARWLKSQPGHSGFAWQAGYGAFSDGVREVNTVVQYIQRQPDHHLKMSFQEEYRQFLDEYGVEYDERYMWD